MYDYINEAFRRLDLITEEAFDVDSDGINNLSNFLDNDDESVRVIDADAKTEEDLATSYIGKVIINCNVCHSHIFKDRKDVLIDTEGVVNDEDACPYCGEEEGFTIVGEIKEFEKDTDNSETEEISDVTNSEEETSTEEIPSEEPVVESLTEHKYKPHTIRLLKLIGSDLVNDETIEEDVSSRVELQDDEQNTESITEDFKEVSITTDDQHLEMSSDDTGKVTVITEPVEAVSTGDEMISPLSDETEAEILDNSDMISEPELSDEDAATEPPVEELAIEPEESDETEVAIDEIDSDSFDELGEAYLTRVYENVESFKTTSVEEDEDKLFVEGLINFKSGSTKKTRFVFEAKDISSSGKLRFIGYNDHLTESKDAFSLVGSVNNNKLFVESLKYNYSTDSRAVRGIVRKSV